MFGENVSGCVVGSHATHDATVRVATSTKINNRIIITNTSLLIFPGKWWIFYRIFYITNSKYDTYKTISLATSAL